MEMAMAMIMIMIMITLMYPMLMVLNLIVYGNETRNNDLECGFKRMRRAPIFKSHLEIAF
jgi:hypothetical protein